MVIQVPKAEYSGTINSLEDLKTMMDEAYQFSNEETVEAPVVPGVSDLTASLCDMTYASATFDGYVIFGESDYAFYMLCYAANNLTDAKKQSFNVSCSTLKETAKEEENNFSTEMTNTIRWFNATYAILTRTNQCNVNYFGGFAANDTNSEAVKEMLDGSWGVTDRTTADETMEWILTEGHRTTYKENMKSLEEAGIKNVAAEEEVPLIDLYTKSRKIMNEAGASKTVEWFMNIEPNTYASCPEGKKDNTHLKYAGAVTFAGLIAEGLNELGGIYAQLLLDPNKKPEGLEDGDKA